MLYTTTLTVQEEGESGTLMTLSRTASAFNLGEAVENFCIHTMDSLDPGLHSEEHNSDPLEAPNRIVILTHNAMGYRAGTVCILPFRKIAVLSVSCVRDTLTNTLELRLQNIDRVAILDENDGVRAVFTGDELRGV